MKVAYLINAYPKPSHSFIRREILALERLGWTVQRFSIRGGRQGLVDPGDIAEYDRTERVLEQGAAVLGLATLKRLAANPPRAVRALRLAARLGWASQRAMAKHFIYLAEACLMAERCQALGITHLHAHFGTNSAAVAMLAHAVGGPTYSFTVHGPEEFDQPHTLSLGAKAAGSAFTVAISSFGRSQLFRWLEARDWDKIAVVHCGLETGLFADPEPVPPGPVRLVSIGRFVEQKGQLLLIEALAQAVKTHPSLHLTLVGDGELRPALEAAIAGHGLQDKVRITGWLAESAVKAELKAGHVMVMPSFAEGLPVVIMEAMAEARPVIATAIAGVPELVIPGETGWIVPAGSIDELAAAMRAAADCPTERLDAMGAAGRTRVLERHDVDREASKLDRLFRTAGAA